MAEGKVELFELNINTKQALVDLRDSQVAVDDLKKEIKKLQKAEGDNSLAIAEATSSLKAEQKELTVNTNITKNVTVAKKAQTGSLDEQRAQLVVVSAQWARLSKDERENTKDGKALTKQKTDLTAALREEETATGDARRGVGDYAGGIKEATGSLGALVPGLGAAGGATKALGFAFKFGFGWIGLIVTAIGLAVGALKSFFTSSEEGQEVFQKLGAIVGVVVGNLVDLFSAFGKVLLEPKQALEDLKNFFADTLGNIIVGTVLAATKRIGKAFLGLGLAWEKFKDVFSDNADGVAKAQEKIVDKNKEIEAADKRVQLGLANTKKAYDSVKDSISDVIAEQDKEIAISIDLSKRQADLTKLRRQSLVQLAKNKDAIQKLILFSRDEKNSIEEQREAILKANEIRKR